MFLRVTSWMRFSLLLGGAMRRIRARAWNPAEAESKCPHRFVKMWAGGGKFRVREQMG